MNIVKSDKQCMTKEYYYYTNLRFPHKGRFNNYYAYRLVLFMMVIVGLFLLCVMLHGGDDESVHV